MKKFLKMGAVSAMLCVSGAANALITTNPGFETGNTTGWTETLQTGAATTVLGTHLTWSAPNGSQMLMISTPDASDDPAANQLVARTDTLAIGDKLDFWFAFDMNPGGFSQDLTDGASLQVTDPNNNVVVSLSRLGSNESPDSFFDTASWTVATAGNHTITFSAFNGTDNYGTSNGLFDMKYTAATTGGGGQGGGGQGTGGTGGQVPEPATLALLGLGLAGLGAARRRKQA